VNTLAQIVVWNIFLAQIDERCSVTGTERLPGFIYYRTPVHILKVAKRGHPAAVLRPTFRQSQ
jgi:hypothetical protein